MLPTRHRRRNNARHVTTLLLLSTALAWTGNSAWAQASTGEGTGSAEQPQPIQAPQAPGGAGLGLVPAELRLTGSSFSLGGSLSETYSSNALGVASGGYDLITTFGLSAGAHDHTLRFDGDLQYSGYADIYARHKYNRISNYLSALANATLVPEHLFFQASAFAQPILVNQFGPVSSDPRFAASGNNTGLTNSYGYVLSPTLAFRLGDFATSQSRLTHSGVFYTRPGGAYVNQTVPGLGNVPSQYLSYSATETIASGQDFSRLNWALSGTAARTKETTLTLDQAQGTAELKYAVTRDFILTAMGGYESITSNQPLVRSLIGPIAMGGFEYQPNPDFQLSASAGTQFNSNSYTGSLYYRFGNFTWLTGQLTDGVSTPSGRFAGNLGSAGVDATGQFYNTSYAPVPGASVPNASNVLAFSSAPLDGSPLNTTVARFRSGMLSLVQATERTQYRLTGFRTVEDILIQLSGGSPSRITTTGVKFDVFRNLTPRVNGSIYVSYDIQNYSATDFQDAGGGLTINYTLSPLTQIFGQASYFDRRVDKNLSFAGSDFTQVTVTIGIRRQFL